MPVCISEKTWKDPFRLTKSLQTSKPKALKLDLGWRSLLKEKIKVKKYKKAENNIISSYQPELTNVHILSFLRHRIILGLFCFFLFFDKRNTIHLKSLVFPPSVPSSFPSIAPMTVFITLCRAYFSYHCKIHPCWHKVIILIHYDCSLHPVIYLLSLLIMRECYYINKEWDFLK